MRSSMSELSISCRRLVLADAPSLGYTPVLDSELEPFKGLNSKTAKVNSALVGRLSSET